MEKKETYVQNIRRFLDVLHSLYKFNLDNHYSLKMYFQDFVDRGVYKSTLYMIAEAHYIAINDGQPLWIAWNENKLFPGQTILKLEEDINRKLREEGE